MNPPSHKASEDKSYEWDDSKFRHAYWPNGRVTKVAMCGYDGPSTWTGEKREPPNMCPICQALLRDRGYQE
jgi:hypothetical protein